MNLYKFIDRPVALQIILALQNLKKIQYTKKSELLKAMPFKINRMTFERNLTNLILQDKVIEVERHSDYKVLTLANNNKSKAIAKPVKNKIIYAQHEDVTVKLTESEYNKLLEKYGLEMTNKMIEKLLNAKVSKGYKYKSDYGAINGWVRDEIEKQIKSTRTNDLSYKDKAYLQFAESVKGATS